MLTRDTAFRHRGPLWLCPLHHTQSRSGSSNLSCSSRQAIPQSGLLTWSTGRKSPPVARGDAGTWEGSLAHWLLSLFFLTNKVKP
jgi:hypothetical protein